MSETTSGSKPLGGKQWNLDQFLEKDVELERFFTRQELDKMTFHEQRRLKNISQNYEIMCYMGLPAIKPDFMKGPAHRAKMAKAAEAAATQSINMGVDKSDSDSDEEWTPDMERKKRAKENGVKRTVPHFLKPVKRKLDEKGDRKTKVKIYKEGKASHFVDAQNKANSNWMRYVNCAMTEADQNLLAFQYKGGIYYCTFKPVLLGEELLVWYGDEYARELGLIRDKNLLFRPKYVNGEEFYPCVYCKIAFTTAVLCVRHLRNVHGCDKLTSYDLQVLDQWLRENDDEYFKKYSKHLNHRANNNMINSIFNGKQKCDISQGDSERKVTSVISQKTNTKNTDEQMYKCELCTYSSNNSGHLKTHMRIHTGERLYKCEVCGKAFNESGNLNKHMRIHTGERLYKCEVCGHAFNHSGNLKTHMMIHTGERLFKCEVCGYACKDSGNLKTHMMIHTGERLFKCEVCCKAFNQSSNLQRHMRIHSGEREHKCEVCFYACNQSGALKTHMRIHTGEKLCKCEVCGKAFNQSGNLNIHMRIHTGERLFKCEVCGKAFNHSGNLNIHMRIHTGERLFKCEVCGHACNQSGDLKKHMSIHTGERLFKCEVCGYAFNQSSALKTHMRIHTGETVQV